MTLSATVTPSSNDVGTVQFKDNGANIGSPSRCRTGRRRCKHTFATAGSHSITAEFSAPASSARRPPRRRSRSASPDLATTTTLTVPQTARTGTEVTLSADVAAEPGQRHGPVQGQRGGDRRTGRDLERHRATAAHLLVRGPAQHHGRVLRCARLHGLDALPRSR
ncbi:hypothetical protein GS432_04850 [Rhodococcus hoagii]|nr:hypothetical protein [Prescottella equi]